MNQNNSLCIAGPKTTAQSGKPLITIITATFNAATHLPATIKSIRELVYDNVEWIIIDGGSTDGTVDLIRRNADVVGRWISEPDHGIYDAWNKGISLARGDWIAFLGAGDAYLPHALGEYVDIINRNIGAQVELVTSKVRFVAADGAVLRVWGSAFEWPIFRKHMNIAHVGALHHRSLFEKYGLFDTHYVSSADYEFLMRCGAATKAVYLDAITADMLTGGISNGYDSIFETYLIHKKYGAGISARFRYWLACIKRFVRPAIRGY